MSDANTVARLERILFRIHYCEINKLNNYKYTINTTLLWQYYLSADGGGLGVEVAVFINLNIGLKTLLLIVVYLFLYNV